MHARLPLSLRRTFPESSGSRTAFRVWLIIRRPKRAATSCRCRSNPRRRMTCRCESTEFPASNGGISAAQKSVEARHGNQRGAETALLPVFLEALAPRLADRVGAGRVPAGAWRRDRIPRTVVGERNDLFHVREPRSRSAMGTWPRSTLPLG